MKYLFLKYNNYYNRRIKKEDSLEAYVDAVPETHGEDPRPMKWAPTEDFNFNPNNYINTEITVNWSEDWNPDYLVCYDGAWNDNNIQHRWFIIESKRTRKGQQRFRLQRDLIADDYDNLTKHTCNILRCNLGADNPLIYNKEPFTYNQIKQHETFLYDETWCPWIVGYMPKGQAISGTITVASDYDVDSHTVSHTDWAYFQYVGSNTVKANIRVVTTRVPIAYERNFWIGGYEESHVFQSRNSNSTYDWGTGTDNQGIRYSESNYNKVRSADRSSWIDWDRVESLIGQVHPEYNQSSIVDTLQSFNGNKVLFSDGVYRISFYKSHTNWWDCGTTIDKNDPDSWKKGVDDAVTQYIKDRFQAQVSGSVKHQNRFAYKFETDGYTLTMVKVAEANTIKYSIPTTANDLIDAPYKMFCMPYPRATADAPDVHTNTAANDKEIIEKVYSDIIRKSTTGTGTDTLYDIQILPYCPIKFKYVTRGATSYYNLVFQDNWNNGIDYTSIDILGSTGEVTQVAGHIFFPKESSFTFTRAYGWRNGSGGALSSMYKVGDIKVANETEFIRIVSPNYSGTYEMVPAKNGGLSAFNIMCTYKPYNPFIEVQPVFSGVYGNNFNDSRGLICTGDFSLPIINNAWTQYELTNKTYQQTFNREIQHMEVGQDIARQQAGFQAAAGAIQGTTTGAMAGFMTGGVYGAIAGAAIGGTTSTIGGVMDYQNLVKQQKEDINYKKDMFNFALQNIKALPNSLAKTSSLNAVSKYVPFIEFYSCTDTEKELLKSFLEYNGMTAGYCGSISPNKFVQANIIKYDGEMDADEVNELNNELLKGVYFE